VEHIRSNNVHQGIGKGVRRQRGVSEKQLERVSRLVVKLGLFALLWEILIILSTAVG
jgi:hypothetical protein